MSRRDEVVVTHRNAIRRAAERRNAESIALVGSIARGTDTEASDFDFVVRFKPNTSLFDVAGLKLDLEELLGRPVDVISAGGLKPKHRNLLADAIDLCPHTI